jgi:hypothetical protein
MVPIFLLISLIVPPSYPRKYARVKHDLPALKLFDSTRGLQGRGQQCLDKVNLLCV